MKTLKNVFKGLGLCLVWIALAVGSQAFAQEYFWEIKAPRHTPMSFASAGVIDDILYVVGGNVAGVAQDAVEAYDPLTNSWIFKTPIPTPRAGAALGVINGKLYVAGGQAWQAPPYNTNALEIYDPSTDTWTAGPPKPGLPINTLAGAAIDDVLYVIGGDYYGEAQNTLYAYDSITNTWTQKASMQSARRHAAAAAIDGKIYVFSGFGPCCTPYKSLEVYDPATDSWTELTTLVSRAAPAAGVIGGKLYITGGADPDTLAPPDLWEYEPSSNTWTERTPMPTARFSPSAGVIGDKLYVVGGIGSIAALATLEAYPSSFGVSPNEGTVGTEIVITGPDLGGGGKVSLQNESGTYAFKVSEWDLGGSGEIKALLKKAVPPGIYDVVVVRKGADPTTVADAFTVEEAVITSVDPDHGIEGDPITINGMFFGTKVKIYLEDQATLTKKCKGTGLFMNKTTGVSWATFRVPKGLPNGTYNLILINNPGAVLKVGFTVGP